MIGLLNPFTLAEKLRAFADRAFGTSVPEPLARVCPGCSQPLDFMCREISRVGNVQTVRCIGCTTRSIWDWGDGVPYLVAHEHEQVAA
jgi:hypothetical protein